MKPSVYVETSVVSYYTARPGRDIIVLAHQEITRQWWEQARERFRLVISELVMAEVGAGDPEAAAKRLSVVKNIPLLHLSEKCREVAKYCEKVLPLAKDAVADAAHLAIASVYSVDYLVTWNCLHIANERIRRSLGEVNRGLGLGTPIICTPEEM